MLSRGLPQVNFQFENNDAYRQLMHLVEEQMPHELTTEQEAEQRRLEEANESNKTYAFYVHPEGTSMDSDICDFSKNSDFNGCL